MTVSRPIEDVSKESFFNLPNSITLSRISLGIVVLVLIHYHFYLSALVLFLITALTDALDGLIARRMGQVTRLGRQLDPLADKLLISTILIFLLPIAESGLQPWHVALIIARELVIQWLRSVLEASGEDFSAKFAGKLKTVAQCVAICLILFVLAFPGPNAWLTMTRDLGILVATGLTVYSGLIYLQQVWTSTPR